MNINTVIDALDLPRNTAESMRPGSRIIVTLNADGSVAIEIRAPAGRPPLVKTPSSLIPVTDRAASPDDASD